MYGQNLAPDVSNKTIFVKIAPQGLAIARTFLVKITFPVLKKKRHILVKFASPG